MDVPLAAFGIAYFVLLSLQTLLGMFGDERLRSPVIVILFWTLVFVSTINVGLFLISIVAIHALCPLCVATYVCSWVCLAGIILYMSRTRINPFSVFQAFETIFFSGDVPNALKRACFAFLILLFSAGIGTVANQYLNAGLEEHKRKVDQEFLEKALVLFSRERPLKMDPEPLLQFGDPDAPIILVEFTDFLCPYCAKASRVVDQLVQDNPHKIRVIVMNYPLDMVCNAYVNQTVHSGSCLFAAAAVCAAEQERFEEFKRIVFSLKLENPKIETLKAVAAKVGLDIPRLVSCVSRLETQDKVLGQIEEARRCGVIGTPILFINGKMYKGKAEKRWLQRFIDLELEWLEKNN
jgi:protein-disulfide isomerase